MWLYASSIKFNLCIRSSVVTLSKGTTGDNNSYYLSMGGYIMLLLLFNMR